MMLYTASPGARIRRWPNAPNPSRGSYFDGTKVLLIPSLRRPVFCPPVGRPLSGDVLFAGDVVTVEWVAPQDSSFFDVFLLNDGNPVSLETAPPISSTGYNHTPFGPTLRTRLLRERRGCVSPPRTDACSDRCRRDLSKAIVFRHWHSTRVDITLNILCVLCMD